MQSIHPSSEAVTATGVTNLGFFEIQDEGCVFSDLDQNFTTWVFLPRGFSPSCMLTSSTPPTVRFCYCNNKVLQTPASSPYPVSQPSATSFNSTFFFFFFKATPSACGSSQARGRIRACTCRPTPQPQHHQIQAISATYAAACSNTRSLTNRARPGTKSASSWILVGFLTL